jgi:hypothetical protein
MTSKTFEGFIMLQYRDSILLGFMNESTIEPEALSYLLKHCFTFSDLMNVIKTSTKGAKIEEKQTDLSFSRFWDTYNHKVGDKKRAEKLWKALSDGDKVLALVGIKKYDNELRFHSYEKCHPSTYLNQRRFENYK